MTREEKSYKILPVDPGKAEAITCVVEEPIPSVEHRRFFC
jgi:hypothetical protein